METPSTDKKTPRSATFLPFNTGLKAGKVQSTSSAMRSSGRRALLDLTNDSPIVGLTLDKEDNSSDTPASGSAKSKPTDSVRTPGTGEALLRSQVRSLLQKVESETIKPPSGLRTLRHLKGFLASPSSLLAPTPANTPEALLPSLVPTQPKNTFSSTLDSSTDLPLDAISLPLSSDKMKGPTEGSTQQPTKLKELYPEVSITRTLVFDSVDDTEANPLKKFSSSASYSQDIPKDKKPHDDGLSDFSVQVNVGSLVEELANNIHEKGSQYFENEDYRGNKEEDCKEEGNVAEHEDSEDVFDELNNMSLHDKEVELGRIPPFAGKHSRFVYNSEDELDQVIVVSDKREEAAGP